MRIYGSKTDQSHLYLLLLIREHHLSHSQQRKYFKVGTILSVICVDGIMRFSNIDGVAYISKVWGW